MSRPEFVANLPADEKKQLDDLRKHNAEALKVNEVVKHLNTDLKTVAADIHDADQAPEAAAQQLGSGATRQAIEAKTAEIKTAKYTEAEDLMSKDTAAKPDASILWARLGQAQIGLKKYDDAETSFKKALDLESTSKKPVPEVQGLAQSGLAEALARQGKTDEAAAAFDEAAKINPTQAAFYLKERDRHFLPAGQRGGSSGLCRQGHRRRHQPRRSQPCGGLLPEGTGAGRQRNHRPQDQQNSPASGLRRGLSKVS